MTDSSNSWKIVLGLIISLIAIYSLPYLPEIYFYAKENCGFTKVYGRNGKDNVGYGCKFNIPN